MSRVQHRVPGEDTTAAAAGRRVRRNVRNAVVAVVTIVVSDTIIGAVTPEGDLAEAVWVLAQFARLIGLSVLLGAFLMGLWSVSTINGVRLFSGAHDQSRPVRRADDLGLVPGERSARRRGWNARVSQGR